MAKLPPERLAQALKANLKRRKDSPLRPSVPEPDKAVENIKENPIKRPGPPPPET
jgi:hypothetical protein